MGWLLRFIGLGLGLGYIQFKEYVNHVVEKAVRCPRQMGSGPGGMKVEVLTEYKLKWGRGLLSTRVQPFQPSDL